MPKTMTKRIHEWTDLCRRLQRTKRRGGPLLRTEQDRQARALLERRHSGKIIAKLTRRLWAVGEQEVITLLYVTICRSTKELRATEAARVFPAAGGRTQYCIPNSVNGWCANKYLPMNASDRETGSSRRHHWYVGGEAIWRPGMGDYYPDAGPRCANLSLRDLSAALDKATHLPEAWRVRAKRFAKAMTLAVRAFGDVLVRFEPEGIDGESRRRLSLGAYNPHAHGLFSIAADYGLRVRLKVPTNGREQIADFSGFIAGPFAVIDESPQVWFGIEELMPKGWRSHCVASRSEQSPEWFMTRKPSKVVAAAREWAARRVRIPCA